MLRWSTGLRSREQTQAYTRNWHFRGEYPMGHGPTTKAGNYAWEIEGKATVMRFEGRVWKFGDDIDTDVIIPARYLNTTDPAVLARHCLEPADAEFARKVQPGDILVAGKNFGCGSSREHAPLALKAAGIACVVAHSFARIFFRNAINIGLPIFESPEAARRVQAGDRLQVVAESGLITNLSRGETYLAAPLPEFIREIIRAGGLMPYVAARKAPSVVEEGQR